MRKSMYHPYRLASEVSRLFSLDSSIETVLAVAMYKLNQAIDSERSSIFLFDPLKQQLFTFSSLDLSKQEIRFSKSSGVAGWVFENRIPAIVDDAYNDKRFYSGVDEVTCFRTRNLICTPLVDINACCSGTLQSLNKKNGDFTIDDLELIGLIASLVIIAINNDRRFNEMQAINYARGKVIKQIVCKGKPERQRNSRPLSATVNLLYNLI